MNLRHVTRTLIWIIVISNIQGCSLSPAESKPPHSKSTNQSDFFTQNQNNQENKHVDLNQITFDDERQVEMLIRSYFDALDRKDFNSALRYWAPEKRKLNYANSIENTYKDVKSVKIKAIKRYLTSPSIEAPPNTPTVYFLVEVEEEHFNQGQGPYLYNFFPDVYKDKDGYWKIVDLGTSPPSK